MPKDNRCVYVTTTQASAIGVSLWLESHGIQTLLMDTTTLGIPVGISFSQDTARADGWQVWVKEESQFNTACQLLTEREENRSQAAELGPVLATCESCGEVNTFEGRFRGTVQDCPKCGQFMDVGGKEEEFEWPE